MSVNDMRSSLSSQRSIVVGDLLSTLLITILLLLTSAPCTRSQGIKLHSVLTLGLYSVTEFAVLIHIVRIWNSTGIQHRFVCFSCD